VLALTDRRRAPATLALPVLIAAVALAVVFHPPRAPARLGRAIDRAECRLAPPRAAARLAVENFGEGAVIDLPAENPSLAFARRGHYVLTAAFHRHPTAACYTSFDSPLAPRIEALGVRLPDRGAAAALHALGFRWVILHEEEYPLRRRQRVVERLATLSSGDPRLVEVGAAGPHRLYRLESDLPTTSDLDVLVAGARMTPPQAAQPLAAPAARVAFTFRNPGPATYRMEPIAPAPFVVRWHADDDHVTLEHHLDAVLPLALAAGDTATQPIAMPVPAAPGPYRVTLAPLGTPDAVVAVASVLVH
jgi:hypothetical protein